MLIILGWNWGKRGLYRMLLGKPEAKSQLGRLRRTCLEIIRMDLWGQECLKVLGGETGGKETTVVT